MLKAAASFTECVLLPLVAGCCPTTTSSRTSLPQPGDPPSGVLTCSHVSASCNLHATVLTYPYSAARGPAYYTEAASTAHM